MNTKSNLAIVDFKSQSSKDSKSAVLEHASNELVFAVVGHVGSGTSEVAKTLQALLHEATPESPAYEAQIVKATDLIAAWATENGKKVPTVDSKHKKLEDVEAFQDLGDQLRQSNSDHAAVAKRFAIRIREIRAEKTGVDSETVGPILPDGKLRAYILDSVRHPAEAELLRHIYQDAFVLVGVVCEESKRLARVTSKYENAGKERAQQFMRRDAKDTEKHGQRVSDAFHLADFFVDNTVDRYKDDKTSNPDWDVAEKLSRLIKIIRHSEIMRPDQSETSMLHAHAAALRSACLSRQVGAALVDRGGSIISTGCNEVPRAGGGVYAETFAEATLEDHRCAYRRVSTNAVPYCSNTREQNTIIRDLIENISVIKPLAEDERSKLAGMFRSGRIGGLLEFSRAVHAEMDAILTAARSGKSTVGTRLFVTTFPCHYCARHIVSAGIDEVQYIEAYPKSQALDLHADSIQISASNWTIPSHHEMSQQVGLPASNISPKVLFRPFTGVAPRLYRRAFGKDRELKNSETGDLNISSPDWGSPWHLRKMSYAQLEADLADKVS